MKELKEFIIEYRTVKTQKELCDMYNDYCHMLISVQKLDEKHSELMDAITSEWKTLFVLKIESNKVILGNFLNSVLLTLILIKIELLKY